METDQFISWDFSFPFCKRRYVLLRNVVKSRKDKCGATVLGEVQTQELLHNYIFLFCMMSKLLSENPNSSLYI